AGDEQPDDLLARIDLAEVVSGERQPEPRAAVVGLADDEAVVVEHDDLGGVGRGEVGVGGVAERDPERLGGLDRRVVYQGDGDGFAHLPGVEGDGAGGGGVVTAGQRGDVGGGVVDGDGLGVRAAEDDVEGDGAAALDGEGRPDLEPDRGQGDVH